MASETEGDVAVPPNLRALLAARLDQLETAERSVLERGAIEGEVFHRGSVQALSGNGQVTPRLAALVRKALVRPDRTQVPGDDAFRFRHLLIRDATRFPKRPGPICTSSSRTGSRGTVANWSSWTKSSATTSSRLGGTVASSARLRTQF